MPHKYSHRGFTLIELLVVIAIIALLSSLIMASLNLARAKARDAQRREDLTQLKRALELYYDDHGSYPYGPFSGVFQEASCGASPAAPNWFPTSSYATGNAWIPGLAPMYIAQLPSDPAVNGSIARCFTYGSSDGHSYVIWDHNGVEASPLTASDPMIRLIAPSCSVTEPTFTVYGGNYGQCN